MDEPYHRDITRRALADLFSQRALQAITAANLSLDTLVGQLMHAEYHFDNNAFEAGYAFIGVLRSEVRPSLEAGDVQAAWRSFGKLTHVVQDFYAHTNYVSLWLEKNQGKPDPALAEVDPLDPDLLASPALRSGRLYYPWEVLAFVPVLKRLVIPLLPRDSHAWMNIDTPDRPGYVQAEAAATRRTRHEFFEVTQGWPPMLLHTFTDLQEV